MRQAGGPGVRTLPLPSDLGGLLTLMQLPVAPTSPVAVEMKAVSSQTDLKMMPDAKAGWDMSHVLRRRVACCSPSLGVWAHLLLLSHLMPACCSVDNTPGVGGDASSCPLLDAPGWAARR